VKHKYTTRSDFDAARVLQMLADDKIPESEALRVIEEACHRIAQLEFHISRIKDACDSLNDVVFRR
jgi:hypothetical protein